MIVLIATPLGRASFSNKVNIKTGSDPKGFLKFHNLFAQT